jgi:hypothetical protein
VFTKIALPSDERSSGIPPGEASPPERIELAHAVKKQRKARRSAGFPTAVSPPVFSGSSCLGTLGISSTERTKANALADALGGVIATHASNDGVTYKSAISAFTGHAVCSSSPWLNGLNLFSTGESYHPNRSGHSSGYLPLVTSATGYQASIAQTCFGARRRVARAQ